MKVKSLNLILLSLLLFSLNSKVFAQPGSSAVPFLLIAPDARSSGMGEVGTGIADDINAIYWNPGGLGFLETLEQTQYGFETDEEPAPFRQVSLAFSPWLPQFHADLYYSYLTFGTYIEEISGTVAINFILMNLGKFERTDENGNSRGEFTSNEFALGASYGTRVSEDVGVGIQVKYVQSNLTPKTSESAAAGTGISGAIDIGFLWKPTELHESIDNLLSIGINLQNFGPKMTYINEADPLPTSLRFGTSYIVYEDEYNSLMLAADVSKLLVKRDTLGSDPLPNSLITGWENDGAEFSIGAEYWYQDAVALRGGYFYEPAVIGGREFYNFGFGLRYEMLKLDFGYIITIEDNNPLANTMRFSLLFDWE